MHSSEGHNGTQFIYNSDMGGDVTIISADGKTEVKVSGDDLIEFIGHLLIREVISRLEGIDPVKLWRKLERAEW